MRNILVTGVVGIMLMSLQVQAQEQHPLKTMKDKVSYGIGVDMARNWKRQGIEADLDLVINVMRIRRPGGSTLFRYTTLFRSPGVVGIMFMSLQAQARQLA